MSAATMRVYVTQGGQSGANCGTTLGMRGYARHARDETIRGLERVRVGSCSGGRGAAAHKLGKDLVEQRHATDVGLGRLEGPVRANVAVLRAEYRVRRVVLGGQRQPVRTQVARQLRVGVGKDLRVDAALPAEVGVVVDDDLPIARQMHVQFQELRAVAHGVAEGRQRVLRALCRAATVGAVQRGGRLERLASVQQPGEEEEEETAEHVGGCAGEEERRDSIGHI